MANVPFLLQLMMGPGIPVPAPKSVTDSLTSVEVTSNTEGASGFQLTFTLASNSPLPTIFLIGGNAPISIFRVVIMVIVTGLPEVLMDGVVTHTQVSPGEGGQSTLTVIGEDLSRVMDYLPLDGLPYPAQPTFVRVLSMLVKYAALGVAPLVIPSVTADVSSPTEKWARQKGTDLSYTRHLAECVGYEFYVDPGPLPLQSIAYWGPRITVSVPQPALNVNMDAWTNVQSLNFSFDSESAELPLIMIKPAFSPIPIPIPIPNVNPLSPPLALIPPIPKKTVTVDTTKQSFAEAFMIGLAKASKTANAATASGSLNVMRYGRVLKARRLVGVRGGGTAFDGLYFVKSVKHHIKRGEYTQDFSLERNGLVSITPRVRA
jgi:Phage late control gene D protein (GPD).